jgi:glycosyltransferase involved in cell wall biosynthesis
MLQRMTMTRPIHVLVAAPAGTRGQGGIDRVMDCLRVALAADPNANVDVTFGSTRGEGHLLFSLFHMSAFCAQMIALKAMGRCDLLHINLASEGSTHRKLLIAALAHRLGIPYVIHLHGADYREYWDNASPRFARAIATMFEGAGQIVVLGTVWAEFIARKLPSARDRISIVPNATARRDRHEHRRDGKVHILFLGRLGDRKGVPQLAEALKGLLPLAGWRATIAGDGPVEEARRQARALGLADRVTLPGWVGPAEVDALLGSADILVLPSLSENLPMSVIEGMAAGLAVVTTPVGAVPDIVTDEVSGLIVPPADVPALTEALRRVITDADLRDRLGRAAQEVHRARLDLSAFGDNMQQAWHRAVATARRNDRGSK